MTKPGVFGSLVALEGARLTTTAVVGRDSEGAVKCCGFGGDVVRVRCVRYSGDGCILLLDMTDAAGSVNDVTDRPVELAWLRVIAQGVAAPQSINDVSATFEQTPTCS